MLSPEETREIDREIAIVPNRSSASIEALKTVQRHRGWVTDEALADVAEYLGMSREELDGVATFYNLIYRRPVGRHVVLVCDSVSCWILGYDRIRAGLERRLGIELGGTTRDGRFTLLPMCCLGACDHAPVLMVDEDTHRDVDDAALDRILESYP